MQNMNQFAETSKHKASLTWMSYYKDFFRWRSMGKWIVWKPELFCAATNHLRWGWLLQVPAKTNLDTQAWNGILWALGLWISVKQWLNWELRTVLCARMRNTFVKCIVMPLPIYAIIITCNLIIFCPTLLRYEWYKTLLPWRSLLDEIMRRQLQICSTHSWEDNNEVDKICC